MAERIKITMYNPSSGHAAMQAAWVECIKPMLIAGHRLVMEVKPETRSDAQNKRLWSILTDVASQVVWHGRKLTPTEWKHVFSASLTKQDVVPGIDGGFVVMAISTSKMTRKEMSELQELIEAFGADHGVRFSAQEYDDEVHVLR